MYEKTYITVVHIVVNKGGNVRIILTLCHVHASIVSVKKQ